MHLYLEELIINDQLSLTDFFLKEAEFTHFLLQFIMRLWSSQEASAHYTPRPSFHGGYLRITNFSYGEVLPTIIFP